MLVSVIVPVFNRKEVCVRALKSVFLQNFDDIEVIVVNDGSTDGLSREYLELELKRDDFKYIDLRMNFGVSYARNRGVEHSEGEWIAFLDSDDVWHKDKVRKEVAFAIANPEFEILQTKEIWIRNGVRVNPPKTHEKRSGDLFEMSLKRCMITPSSVMLKKSLFIEKGCFNESLRACEDFDLWLKITVDHKVGLVDEFLMTRYGGHDDQLSKTVPLLDRYRIRSMLDILKKSKLDNVQKKLLSKELAKRCMVVASGAEKRGRTDEFRRYQRIAESLK